jgi:hypothetical protein
MTMDGRMMPVVFFVLFKDRNPRIEIIPRAMELIVNARKQVSMKAWASGFRANMKAEIMAHVKKPAVRLAVRFHILFILQFFSNVDERNR